MPARKSILLRLPRHLLILLFVTIATMTLVTACGGGGDEPGASSDISGKVPEDTGTSGDAAADTPAEGGEEPEIQTAIPTEIVIPTETATPALTVEPFPTANTNAVMGSDGCAEPGTTVRLLWVKDGDQANEPIEEFEYEGGSFVFPFDLPNDVGCCNLILSYTKASNGSAVEVDDLSCAPDEPCFISCSDPKDPPQPDPKGRIFGTTACVDAGSLIEMYRDTNGDGKIDATGENATAAFSETMSGSSFSLFFDPENGIETFIFQATRNGQLYQRSVVCEFEEWDSSDGCLRNACQ